jgi:manganese transport protein
VFGLALLRCSLVTAVIAFGILVLEQFGYCKFELAIIALLGFVAAGLLLDFFAIGREPATGIARGFVPRLGGRGSVTLVVAIIGATVMPHVIYPHSAQQKNRVRPANLDEARVLLRYNRWECIIGLSADFNKRIGPQGGQAYS